MRSEAVPLNRNRSRLDLYSASGWERIYGGKDLWKGCVSSLEWKRVGVMDGESGDDETGETS